MQTEKQNVTNLKTLQYNSSSIIVSHIVTDILLPETPRLPFCSLIFSLAPVPAPRLLLSWNKSLTTLLFTWPSVGNKTITLLLQRKLYSNRWQTQQSLHRGTHRTKYYNYTGWCLIILASQIVYSWIISFYKFTK